MAEIDEYHIYTIQQLINLAEQDWRKLADKGQMLHGPNRELLYPSYRIGAGFDQVDESSIEGKIFRVLADAFDTSDESLGSCLQMSERVPDHIESLNLAASSASRPYAPADLEGVPEDAIKKHLKKQQVKRRSDPKAPSMTEDIIWYPVGVLPYGGRLGQWWRRMRNFTNALKKVLTALASSETFDEAYSKIAAAEQRQRFVKIWSPEYHRDGRLVGIEHYRARNHTAATHDWRVTIPSRFKEVMELLKRCLAGDCSFEETWWKCLWVSMQPAIDELLAIETRLNENVPLEESQLNTLQLYLCHGDVQMFRVVHRDGKHQRRLMLVARSHGDSDSPFLEMATALLVQPAFALSQRLHESFAEPKFEIQCRAPSCSRRFYTRRHNQRTCPGSQGNRKNKCALEWTAYSRWLRKIGKEPETDWPDPNLQAGFKNR